MMEEFRTPPEISFEPGPGSRLRQAREAANRSIGEVSAALHLDPQMVEALEADSFDRLPPPTFVRGYLKGYARLLGLPPGPILEVYDRRGFEPPPLVPDVTQTPQTHPSDLAVRLATYGIGVILVVLVVLWWRSQDFRGSDILDAGRDLIGWLPESTPASPDGGEGDGGPAAAAGASPGPPEGAGPAGGAEPTPSGHGPSPGGGISTAEPLPPTDGAAAEGMAVTGSPPPDDGLPFGGAGAGGVDAAEPPSPPSAGGAAAEGTAAVGPSAGDDPSPGGGAEASGMAATGSPLPPSGEDAGAGVAATTESPPPSTAIDTTAGSVASTEPPPPSVDGDGAAAGTIPGAGTTPGPGTAAAPGIEAGAGIPEREDAPAPEGPDDTPLVISVGPPVPATGASLLVVEFTHESWVEIYDRDRAALFFDLVPPGRVLRITGTPPFDVLFGNSEGIRMTLDGTPFDYTQYVKRGIARFKAGAAPGDEPDDDDAGAVPPAAAPSPGGTDSELPSGEAPRPGF